MLWHKICVIRDKSTKVKSESNGETRTGFIWRLHFHDWKCNSKGVSKLNVKPEIQKVYGSNVDTICIHVIVLETLFYERCELGSFFLSILNNNTSNLRKTFSFFWFEKIWYQFKWKLNYEGQVKNGYQIKAGFSSNFWRHFLFELTFQIELKF